MIINSAAVVKSFAFRGCTGPSIFSKTGLLVWRLNCQHVLLYKLCLWERTALLLFVCEGQNASSNGLWNSRYGWLMKLFHFSWKILWICFYNGKVSSYFCFDMRRLQCCITFLNEKKNVNHTEITMCIWLFLSLFSPLNSPMVHKVQLLVSLVNIMCDVCCMYVGQFVVSASSSLFLYFVGRLHGLWTCFY